ncbi:MAG TPA: polymer-forming cytoskeletal protein [Paenibacillus sp.]|nr:polymer-forming cytoskeletal protein [Paenibacillus sp.]
MAADLKMSGIGSAAGGVYRLVSIEGVGTVGGSLSCAAFRSNGICTVKGDIRSDDRLDVNGKLTGEGVVDAPRIAIDGQATLNGRLRADRIALNGFATIRGDVEAEAFDAEGAFAIEGLLNAGTIDAKLQGRSRAGDIGCDRIVVKRSARRDWSRLLAWLVPLFQPQLSARTIEGNDVELAETRADIVRGDRVAIGPGCEIGEVEYGIELTVHPEAKVGKRTKR